MADPYLSNVSLLMHFRGAAGSTFFPAAAGSQQLVYNQNVYASSIQTAVSKFGEGAVAFSSANQSRIILESSPDYSFGTGDFTVEAWVYKTANNAYDRAIQFGNPSHGHNDAAGLLVYDSDPSVGEKVSYFNYRIAGATRLVVSSAVMPLNTWVHVAVTRASGVFRLFVNGVLESTNSSYVGVPHEVSSSNVVSLGGVLAPASPYNEGMTGYMNDARITKGVARYTTSFTPPAAHMEPDDRDSTFRSIFKPLTPRTVPGYNLEPQSPRRRLWAKGGYWRWETQTTGSGTISGIVTIENIPGSRKVRLYRKHDGMLLRETWSAPNGAYSFSNLDPAWEYFVVAHDHLRVYNGVIQDMITP